MITSIVHAESLAFLRSGIPDNYFDAVVTDGPYELGFMGKAWDSTGIVNDPDFWREVLRVMKPGAHLLSFGHSRTAHRMICAIEDAGFELRDTIDWIYGTGFPKSYNELGDGLGTALKPGKEPIAMARKPLEGTLLENHTKWGTGALNIDACRIEANDGRDRARKGSGVKGVNAFGHSEKYDSENHPGGRWPANVLLDEDAAAELDAQSGVPSSTSRVGKRAGKERGSFGAFAGQDSVRMGHSDSGGASRFFYIAKPGRKERDFGCDHLPAKSGGEATDREEGSAGTQNPRAGAGRNGGARNYHPTVKPVELMQYLIRLVTPPGGTVLDPFCGSGTTGIAAVRESRGFVGVEMSEEYCTIARARVSAALREKENP